MAKPKMKGSRVIVSIRGMEEDVKKLVEQGYTLKYIFETGAKVLLTKDKNVEAMLKLGEELTNLHNEIQRLREVILFAVPLGQTMDTAKRELLNLLNELSTNLAKINTELKLVSENILNNLKRISDIESDLKKILERYQMTFLEEILRRIEEIENARSNISKRFNIYPNNDDDMFKMAQNLAMIKQIISKLKEST